MISLILSVIISVKIAVNNNFSNLQKIYYTTESLEEEAKQYLGRDYYQREAIDEHNGYRNGYKTGKLKTAEGKLNIQKPQISDSPEPFRSNLWNHIKGNTDTLEQLAVEMYARGCSTRDVEEILKDENGNLLLSKSSISARR